MSNILAASPVFDCGHGSAKRRAVLRIHQAGFVVHWEFFYADGSRCFGSGDYFSEQGGDTKQCFNRAYARWLERCQELSVYTPTGETIDAR